MFPVSKCCIRLFILIIVNVLPPRSMGESCVKCTFVVLSWKESFLNDVSELNTMLKLTYDYD